MSRGTEAEAGPGAVRHLSRELLDGLFAGERSAFEILRLAVGHLEADCPPCREALAAAPVDCRSALAVAEERARASLAALGASPSAYRRSA